MFVMSIIDFILHIDVHLAEIISQYGMITYAILFGIVFAETGFVLTPFLPGDSLLFAAGAFAALGSLNVYILILLLCIAAVGGDTANYWIGHFFGKKIIDEFKEELFHEAQGVLTSLGGAVDLEIYPGLGHQLNDDEIKRVKNMIAGV